MTYGVGMQPGKRSQELSAPALEVSSHFFSDIKVNSNLQITVSGHFVIFSGYLLL